MDYQTRKLDTATSYSAKLASDMTKNCDGVKGVSLESSAQGSTAIVDYMGMLYRVEFIPTYRELIEDPAKPTLKGARTLVDECNELECDNCEYRGHEIGGNDLANPDCQPDEHYCMQLVDECCPAAERKLSDLMECYDEEMESINHA